MAVSLVGKIFMLGLAVHFFKKLLDRLFATTFHVHSEG
jgi:hypothetical protein